jgi:hypothetical protein
MLASESRTLAWLHLFRLSVFSVLPSKCGEQYLITLLPFPSKSFPTHDSPRTATTQCYIRTLRLRQLRHVLLPQVLQRKRETQIWWHMRRSYNKRGMSVNILAATNTGNNRSTAVSTRRPVNNFPLKNVKTTGNPLLWMVTRLRYYSNGRCFLWIRAASI